MIFLPKSQADWDVLCCRHLKCWAADSENGETLITPLSFYAISHCHERRIDRLVDMQQENRIITIVRSASRGALDGEQGHQKSRCEFGSHASTLLRCRQNTQHR